MAFELFQMRTRFEKPSKNEDPVTKSSSGGHKFSRNLSEFLILGWGGAKRALELDWKKELTLTTKHLLAITSKPFALYWVLFINRGDRGQRLCFATTFTLVGLFLSPDVRNDIPT